MSDPIPTPISNSAELSCGDIYTYGRDHEPSGYVQKKDMQELERETIRLRGALLAQRQAFGTLVGCLRAIDGRWTLTGDQLESIQAKFEASE